MILGDNSQPVGDCPVIVVDRDGDSGNGVAVVNPDNTITYTPDPNCIGPDRLQYTCRMETLQVSRRTGKRSHGPRDYRPSLRSMIRRWLCPTPMAA